MLEHGCLLLAVSPALLLGYIAHRKDEAQCWRVWHVLLNGIAQHPEEAEQAINPLLDAARRGVLPVYLKPHAGELNAIVERLVEMALTLDAERLVFVNQVLEAPGNNPMVFCESSNSYFVTLDYFLSENGYSRVVNRIIVGFTFQVQLAVSDIEDGMSSSLGNFRPALELITALAHYPSRTLPPRKIFDTLLPDIFILAYLLPECYPSLTEHDRIAIGVARDLWEDWMTVGKAGDGKDGILERIKAKLRVLLCDTQVRPLYVFSFRYSLLLMRDVMQTSRYPPDRLTGTTTSGHPITYGRVSYTGGN